MVKSCFSLDIFGGEVKWQDLNETLMDDQAKVLDLCTKQRAVNVVRNVKYHSSQLKVETSFVKNVLHRNDLDDSRF